MSWFDVWVNWSVWAQNRVCGLNQCSSASHVLQIRSANLLRNTSRSPETDDPWADPAEKKRRELNIWLIHEHWTDSTESFSVNQLNTLHLFEFICSFTLTITLYRLIQSDTTIIYQIFITIYTDKFNIMIHMTRYLQLISYWTVTNWTVVLKIFKIQRITWS